ncbi:hypothetical protein [Polyangium mundeleinium]|uniref:Dickkopf N-terminal cysteine-rich domain-containing protein n=1 Tax=Polyangium mundeleinium TaxID=2995306 RepID=A0ABT5F660_9BACT|nr:hypothetical protein [Polyangium mundeleinium]MDC0749599.1 hypothetical protein [Polyangium mundeleinium]
MGRPLPLQGGSWARSVAGVFALLLLGCGAAETPPNLDAACHDLVVPACGSVEIPADVVSACHDLFLRRVAFAERCTGPSVLPSAADEQAYVDTCAGIATAPGVTLTPLDIKACADQMDASPCLGGGVFPSCVGYGGDLLYPGHDKKGTFTLGDVCFANVQCQSGHCDHSVLETCGVCKRARADGESCTEATDLCVEGSCREGTCQPPGKKLGEECISHGIECQLTLYCKHTDSGPSWGTCVPRGQAGASCDANNYCADGLSCRGGVCETLAANGAGCSDDAMCASTWCKGGTCATRPTGLTEGESCSVGFCRADLLCDESAVCTAPTYLPDGAACTSASFPKVQCEPGLYCHEECSPGSDCQGACRPYPQPGEPCTSLSCAAGAYCTVSDPTDLTKSLCVKWGSPGEACPCAHGLACVSGVCVAYGVCQ